jgi:hypothetical protein
LRQVNILGAGTHPDAGEFNFADGSRTITVGRTLKPGDTAQFQVVYNPTLVQFTSAIIEYTWDTVATPGCDALSDTLSALSVDTKPYSVKTGEFFDVPIRIAHMLPTRAAAFGYTFKVTYKQDLFDNLRVDPASGLIW